jgi:HK97 gp10 family phage protein
MAKVTIRGLNELKQKLREQNQKANNKVKFAVAESGSSIKLKAILKVPVNLGKLKQSIALEIKKEGLLAEVSANKEYAPYVEFGTGQFTKVPKGFEEIAMSFYVNGKGTMKPKPYLIPSWASEVPIFRNKLKKIIKEMKL